MGPLRVITLASNKGGVGKTTLATNLAVYLRSLREDLPVLVLGLDDQDFIERLFALDDSIPERTVLDALRDGELEPAIRPGQYGVHYVPHSPAISNLEAGLQDPFALRSLLARTDWDGLVILDTKSDLGILTQNALAASDLALVAVSDRTSLDQAERIYALLDAWGRPREAARIVLSLVDLRVKFREQGDLDILALLVSEIRRRGHPLFQSFISRSPKIESLATNPGRRARSILHGARGSLIDRQMAHLAAEVLRALGGLRAEPSADVPPERRRRPRQPFAGIVPAFRSRPPPVMALRARDVSADGLGIEAAPGLCVGERLQLAVSADAGDETLLIWARVVRDDGAGRMALSFEPAAPAAHRQLAQWVSALPAQTA
jgi:cellulose biosynthesis protein BcsQ